MEAFALSVVLAHVRLSEFSGPALCVYNNAEFSETDFKSITRIGDSGKAKRHKVGRFGVGVCI